MKVLDLFSGIGGFALGLQRAGFTTKYFCEIDPYCRQVLAKHWPNVSCFEDVRTLRGADLGPIDLICGGFPCQDISLAGKGAGLSGSRSGLWSEYARLIGEVRPKYVLIENVAVLRSRGLDQVLREIAALGYDAEWHCIPACAVGAPHRRDRVWIVAGPHRGRFQQREPQGEQEAGGTDDVADSHTGFSIRENAEIQSRRNAANNGGEDVSDPNNTSTTRQREHSRQVLPIAKPAGFDGGSSENWWAVEPTMGELVNGVSGGLVRFNGRVATKIPNRVNKLRGLGNAIVPQIAEALGRMIMKHEAIKIG